jgi:tRNA (cmo5U34)-methyltransferase
VSELVCLRGSFMSEISPGRTTHSASRLRIGGRPDRLFSDRQYPSPFAFTREVAEVFDDMVLRSIPFYEESIRMLCEWGRRFYQPGTHVVDLGSSTGTTLIALAEAIAEPTAKLIGVDNSGPMVEVARAKFNTSNIGADVEFRQSDILLTEIRNASIVIMNYTLQFIPVAKRPEILQRIHDGLNPGGIFFLSEKIRSGSPCLQEAQTSIYESFKYANGYSDDEISRKKAALDQVLVPFTLSEHFEYLYAAGFRSVEPVMFWNNFISLVALK